MESCIHFLLYEVPIPIGKMNTNLWVEDYCHKNEAPWCAQSDGENSNRPFCPMMNKFEVLKVSQKIENDNEITYYSTK